MHPVPCRSLSLLCCCLSVLSSKLKDLSNDQLLAASSSRGGDPMAASPLPVLRLVAGLRPRRSRLLPTSRMLLRLPHDAAADAAAS